MPTSARTEPGGEPVSWGQPYACPMLTSRGELRWLYRRDERHRWYTGSGRWDGPELDNLALILAWAYWQGWQELERWENPGQA